MARAIITHARMWNFGDEVLVERGLIRLEEMRSVEPEDAIVDTRATRLVLTEGLVQRLGLSVRGEISVRYADNRTARKSVARGVVVEILERSGTFDAVIEERGQPLIGMEILEALDLWPDPQRGILTTNPLSPDMPLYNLLRVKPCPLP